MELQENLTKLIEQNKPVQFISSGNNPGEAVAALQNEGIVDDLVKVQSAFLRNHQEPKRRAFLYHCYRQQEAKVSTEALIDSFKKINEDKEPAPITVPQLLPKDNRRWNRSSRPLGL